MKQYRITSKDILPNACDATIPDCVLDPADPEYKTIQTLNQDTNTLPKFWKDISQTKPSK